jgi:hypothetical protein
MAHHRQSEGYALGLLDQADALDKVAPATSMAWVSEFVDLAVAHGSPPDKAKSVAEQGSVVKVQVLAEKSSSTSGCRKLTLGIRVVAARVHCPTTCCAATNSTLRWRQALRRYFNSFSFMNSSTARQSWSLLLNTTVV